MTNPIPSSDLDALVEQMTHELHVFERFSGMTCPKALTAITSLRNESERLAKAWETQHEEKVKEKAEAKLWFEKAQEWKARLTASKARERETEAVILTLVQLVREYLPPDGISKDEFINRVLGVLDNDEMAELVGELEGRDA